MPCETVEVTAPAQPNILASRTGVSTSVNQVTVSWRAENDGGATGTGTFTVSAGGKSKDVTVTLNPGENESGQETFNFNFSSERTVDACVGSSCTQTTVPVDGQEPPPDDGGLITPKNVLVAGGIGGALFIASASQESRRDR